MGLRCQMLQLMLQLLQLSWLLTQQMSWLLTQQMSCLQPKLPMAVFVQQEA